MGKVQNAADIIRCCVLHQRPGNSNLDPVTRRLTELVAYTSSKAKEIDKGWLHTLRGASWEFEVEYHGERKTKPEDRLIGITCPRLFFDDVMMWMQKLGVYHSHNKQKKLVMVSVQKFASVNL